MEGGEPGGGDGAENREAADEEYGEPVNDNGDGLKIKAGVEYLDLGAVEQAGTPT